MKTLVIAEKPSVAQDIVRALTPQSDKFEKHDNHFENAAWVVTSAVGHLVEIAAPEGVDVKRGKWSFANLPVLPQQFEVRPIEKSKTRLNAVIKLIKRKDVGHIINACDAGREGELIFRLILQYAQGAKTAAKPVQRLWLQSMTPQAIREGFAALRSDQSMQPLADAARCRSEADWLVGINGTRAMTAFNSRDGGFFLTTVGRVQTPTLSLVVSREEAIRKFVPRAYWEVHASFCVAAGAYAGKWFDPDFKKNEDSDRREDRLWDEAKALAIVQAVQGQRAQVTDKAKSSSKSSPPLFDLTSLQREANARFGYSAKTTLQLAQSLYERHKALTYPRTDSRALPEDYLPTVEQTVAMLADSGLKDLAPHAQKALADGYIRKLPRVFDNKKISDHFAIIPTLQAPSGLSEAEFKLYGLVVRRFLAVFYPAAEFFITTRISRVAEHAFKSEGKVLVKPGWLAIYGQEVQEEGDDDKALVPLVAGEDASLDDVLAKALHTRPPARYSEATLLSAMESVGKRMEDDELREAMEDKGLGTPATRAAIIEGLLGEKYMLREGKELSPTAKAFQLMTLLRGLDVEVLTSPELTGDWEHKLSLMERGELSRQAFMRDITEMTERVVAKAKSYDRDTVPGDYATLSQPCPQCGGVVRENYRRYACVGADGQSAGCGFSFTKSPGARLFEAHEADAFLQARRIGPLDGFRSKAGWPFAAELALVQDDDTKQWKLEFDFGQPKDGTDDAPADFSGAESLGGCPKCTAPVYEHGNQYVCAKSVSTPEQTTPSCDFKSGKIILQQPVAPEQMRKLLTQGKTDLLDKFVSMRTRRAFKAFLVYDAKAGKVAFEFEPRAPRAPRKTVARKRGGQAAG
jgi:DNA topoisomerase-3